MKYAVVKIGGSQYKIEEGIEFFVDRLPQKEGEEIEISDVLLLVDNEQVNIGQPVLANFQIKAKILGHEKGKKIRVARFRAKSRYRKVKGFRPSLTKIRIEKIGTTEALKRTETQKRKTATQELKDKKTKKLQPPTYVKTPAGRLKH